MRSSSRSLPRRALLGLLALVLGLGALLAPSPAHAASPAGTGWAAAGPGITRQSDGSVSSPSYSYDTPGTGKWTFVRTATSAGQVPLPYVWTGNLDGDEVVRRLSVGKVVGGAFVESAVLVDESIATVASPTTFRYAGTATLSVAAGEVYGFRIEARRKSGPKSLTGTFTLPAPPTLALPADVVGATATGPSGAVVSYSASAVDETGASVPVRCSPASGTVFPRGDTRVDCTATSDTGQTATGSFLVRVYDDQLNIVWPKAASMGGTDTRKGWLRQLDQALWYRFPVQPDSVVEIELTNLSADYDLTVFGDIGAAFVDALTPTDLNRLTAEFAADAYSPSAFSPSAFSPSAFSPSAFSPSAFSPSAFSPSAFSPSAFSPSAFSPSAFSPSAFSPSAFSPSAFSPAVSLPSAFSPSAFSPSAFSESDLAQAFSSAQTRTLLAVSARNGLADEHVKVNTWGEDGEFYVRVQGRNGAFVPQAPFTLTTRSADGPCAAPLQSYAGQPTFRGSPGAARTVILTDSSRLTDAPMSALQAFADRPEIRGVVVDAATIPRVASLQSQADAVTACAFAKNLVADELRRVVNSFRDPAGTLEYVVIAGGDDVIPYVRSFDSSGLGPESSYVPPVRDDSSSQAALRRNQVLSQDAYGAPYDVELKGASVPMVDVAVGRLVETPAEITAALDRYAALGGGVLPTRSALVSGYDFLTDNADAVSDELRAGLGGPVDELITNRDVPPSTITQGAPDRRHSWTADDLRTALKERHDVVFLAGHFSANNALAADHRSAVSATELLAPSYDLGDSLVMSVGCHSGYGIVDGHAVPLLTEPTDWAQVMARKGATFLAGTGYQYGDTDFLEYSERLYTQVTRELRTGSGPVSVGQALVDAKRDYLATTPVLSGIHQKALAEATLFGLPMVKVDLPGERLAAPSAGTVAPSPVADGPGSVLGLKTLDLTASGATTLRTQAFDDRDRTGLSQFTYLSGRDGVTTSPGQPALPLESLEVRAPGMALRGVGFRGGTYTDLAGVVPLTGAAATDVSEVHTAFRSPVFFPRRLAQPNTVGELADDGGTHLLVTPAQHRTEAGGVTSTLRRYSGLDLRLLYSGNTQQYSGNKPALAAPPAVSTVSSSVQGDTVTISTHVVGDPSAGIQSVWVTRTAEKGPWHGAWASVDLVQAADDSTLWTGTLTLPPGQSPDDVRFIVQAANGVGLVTMEDNQGREYIPGVDPAATGTGTGAVTLTLTTPDAGVLGDQLPVAAALASGSGPVPGRLVRFDLGGTSTSGVTDQNGVARASLPLAETPGDHQLVASFDGDPELKPTTTTRSIVVAKRPTQLTLAAAGDQVVSGRDTGVVATLRAGSNPVTDRTVLWVVRDAAGEFVAAAARRTRPDGTAELGRATLPAGQLTVTAYFGRDDVRVGDGRTAGSTDPENAPSISAPLPLTVVEAGPPAAIAVESGSAQGAEVGTRFGSALVVSVTDARGIPTPGATVTFTSPATGPGTAPRVLTAVTGEDGRASVRPTAGADVGAYQVVASVPGAGTAEFTLVNRYILGAFGAPFAAPDGGSVEVPQTTVAPLTVQVSTTAGPIADATALQLSLGCQVALVTTVQGSSTRVCLVYDPTSKRFSGALAPLLQGWAVGSSHEVKVEVTGSDGSLLGLRRVTLVVT